MQSPPTPFHTARQRSIKNYSSEWLNARCQVITAMIALGHGRWVSRHNFGQLCFQRSLCARELRKRCGLAAVNERFGRPEDQARKIMTNKDRNGG